MAESEQTETKPWKERSKANGKAEVLKDTFALLIHLRAMGLYWANIIAEEVS